MSNNLSETNGLEGNQSKLNGYSGLEEKIKGQVGSLVTDPNSPSVEVMIKKVNYKDLLNMRVIDNGEKFVSLKEGGIKGGHLVGMDDMSEFFSGEIIVREMVLKKLIEAEKRLKSINGKYSLYVTYGFRNLEIQTRRFLDRLKIVGEEFIEDPIELYEKVHCSIAVPTVAGHPTGGAVDVLIINEETNTFLDFGTKIYDYSVDSGSAIHYKNISDESQNNRLLLSQIMASSGFAPYIEEYWHFSFGDKEWAFYYEQENAIYSQKNIGEIEVNF